LFFDKEDTEVPISINSDYYKVKKILSSLISNAIKFTEEGYVKYGYKRIDNDILFYVEDTGIGIKDDVKNSIFESFRQAEDALSRRYSGTGLGLSISKGFVELLNGKIWVESEVGKGSRFYFQIPTNSGVDNAPETKKIIDKPKITTVLVAEDEETNYAYIEELLASYNISTIRAKNGEEAILKSRIHDNIDLILMDLKMPGVDGYQATKQILNDNRGVPIVAFTAFALMEDRDKALDSGCSDYLAKPLTEENLFRVLSKYIQINRK